MKLFESKRVWCAVLVSGLMSAGAAAVPLKSNAALPYSGYNSANNMSNSAMPPTAAAAATAFAYDCTDCPWTIGPDPSTITSTISVADSGTILPDLDLFVDMTHTFSGDLIITLEHNGTSAIVHSSTDGGVAPYDPTLYSDLSVFTGMDIMGDWNLTVEDEFFADGGLLASWTISGDTEMVAVSEPGMLVLMGLGLVGIGFARRRR